MVAVLKDTVRGRRGEVDATIVAVRGGDKTVASMKVGGRAAYGDMASTGGETAGVDTVADAVVPGTTLQTVARIYIICKINQINYFTEWKKIISTTVIF